MELNHIETEIELSCPQRATINFTKRTIDLFDIFTEEIKESVILKTCKSFDPVYRSSTCSNKEFIASRENDYKHKLKYSDSYIELIDDRLYEMKSKMIEELDEFKANLMSKYDQYIYNIKENIIEKTIRLTNLFEDTTNSENCFYSSNRKEFIKKYTMKNVFDKLENMFEIHDKITNSIKENLEILTKFLDDFDLLYHQNPQQSFVENYGDMILRSWVFNKIDFEKLNMIKIEENQKLPRNLHKFIYQDTLNKFSRLQIKKSKTYDVDKSLMIDNKQILNKITFIKFNNEEFQKIFQEIKNIQGIKFDKVTRLDLDHCSDDNILMKEMFPRINKLQLTKTKLRIQNLSNFSLSRLTQLVIKKSNLNTLHFNSLINFFNEEIFQNLQTLDLSYNNITIIDLANMAENGLKFSSLTLLNLAYNQIYKFKPQNFICLPSIRMVNFYFNNFTDVSNFLEIKEKIKRQNLPVLVNFCKNLFVLNNSQGHAAYYCYLKENLCKFDFLLTKLNLSFLLNKFNQGQLICLTINSNIQVSLKKLDLSFNSLESETVINFIKNHPAFLNMRRLSLNSNRVDDKFLELYSHENIWSILENLEVLDLSNNKITEQGMKNLETIIRSQRKLNLVILKENPIEERIVQFLIEGKSSLHSVHSNIKTNDQLLDNSNETIGDKTHTSLEEENLSVLLYSLLDLKKDIKLLLGKSSKKKILKSKRNKLQSSELMKLITFDKRDN